MAQGSPSLLAEAQAYMHMLKQRLLLHSCLQGAPVSKSCILVRHCKSWWLLAPLYLLIKQSHLP